MRKYEMCPTAESIYRVTQIQAAKEHLRNLPTSPEDVERKKREWEKRREKNRK